MAHQLETIDGSTAMVYVGKEPWHGLGKKIPADLTPEQALRSASLADWDVHTVPLWAEMGDGRVHSVEDEYGLVRGMDKRYLGTVSADWHIVQNEDAFAFFNDFTASGEVSIHTAGSLHEGKIVWVLAKTNESFEILGRDRVDGYMLFTNYFKYGFSTDVRFTSVRVVCANTHTSAIQGRSGVRVSHRRVFDGDEVKKLLGVSKQALALYKERSEYLGSKRAKGEDVVEYFKRVFPLRDLSNREISRNADTALGLLTTQPGADLGEGSWWPVYNTVTYMTDHKLGRSPETRLSSAWYGANQKVKEFALDIALEYAEQS